MYNRFAYYGPDIDPTTPGLIKDGENIIPTPAGYRSAYRAINSGVSEMTATCVGAVSVLLLNDASRTLAGTGTQLYETDDDHWTAVTRTAADYTAGASWDFAQYGDETYATNDAAVLQRSTGGVFADTSGAPSCKIVEVVLNQVMALNTNDATFGDDPNRWWCSALGDGQSWAPSIATQAASGTLVDTPGSIVAGKRLGVYMVAYKKNSTYIGDYQGPPTVWNWRLVSDEIGCVGLKAVTSVENVHYFMGTDDFYAFNGTYPTPIGGPIREFFFQSEINRDNAHLSIAVHNRKQGLVYFFYVSNQSSSVIDRYIAYHIATQKWSPPTAISIETAFEYISPAITYNSLGNFYATYDDLPDIPYDDPFWITVNNLTGVFNTSHRLQTLDAVAASMSITMWDVGSEDKYSFLRRVRPRFKIAPTSGTMVNSYVENLGESWVSDAPTSVLSDGKFDTEREARWHSVRMDYSGETEIVGVDLDILGEGVE